MDSPTYICEYCHKEFEPKRRRVQKYCSDSCRVKAHHARKNKEDKKKESTPTLSPQKQKVEQVTLAGVGNSAFGTLAADAAKHIFTAEKNRPATKGDLADLKSTILSRYHLVKNFQPRNGSYPYFDIETNEVVYLNPGLIK
ncbi:hypothetical protein [Mangrovimonas aestuarii]|uniref:hypothetical protein n=1 Tax=Mangrovimonas aestuarii TaxID=3018443 RepID=UPI0023795C4C|nr:hypothetical protein [Mangrovimonas aestuarii]